MKHQELGDLAYLKTQNLGDLANVTSKHPNTQNLGGFNVPESMTSATYVYLNWLVTVVYLFSHSTFHITALDEFFCHVVSTLLHALHAGFGQYGSVLQQVVSVYWLVSVGPSRYDMI